MAMGGFLHDHCRQREVLREFEYLFNCARNANSARRAIDGHCNHRRFWKRLTHDSKEHAALSTTDDPDELDVRRRQLAKRLVSHQARTQTITEYTGLSRDCLETLRRRWGVSAKGRHRGPSPTALTEFFRTTNSLHAATATALFFYLLGTLQTSNARHANGTFKLELGEQLCYAYEALQACLPQVEIEFEYLVLLATGMSGSEVLQLTSCAHCGIAILVDQLASPQNSCRHQCREDAHSGVGRISPT
jgi:hypothetical protein